MINVEELKSRTDIKGGLEYYGLQFNSKGFAVCPFHKEKTPSLYIYPKDNFFVCFGCGVKGDLVQFVKMFFGISFKEALKKIDTDFHLGLTDAPCQSGYSDYIDKQINRVIEKEERKRVQIYDEYCFELRALNKAARVIQGASREAVINRISEIEKDMEDMTGYALQKRYEKEK